MSNQNAPIVTLKKLLIATTCISLMFVTHANARTTTPTNTTTSITAKAVTLNAFLDSLGVNTHFDYTSGNAYSNVASIENQLKYTGIRYARDHAADASQMSVLKKVNTDIGTKFDILVSESVASQITMFQSNVPVIKEVEGANEIDNWPDTINGVTGPSAAVTMQKQIYSGMKAVPALANFPINSLTIADAGQLASVGNIASYTDFVSSHIYPQFGGNSTPYGNLQWSIPTNQIMAPGKPAVITEFGWWTQPMSYGIPYDVHAKYTLNFFLDAFCYGIRRSYIYELSDEIADTHNSTIEYHFGLFQANGTPKPAANALANMTKLLADPTPLAATTGLPITISKSSSAPLIRSLLMERGDKVFVLALWQDPLLWDTNTQRSIGVAAQQALVSFGVTARSAQVYDPLVGLTATANYTNAGGITTMVPDHPIFIFIQQ